MQNMLLKYFRDSSHLSPTEIASRLGISRNTYRDIESGNILISPKQSQQLADLYNTQAYYLYQSAAQLDLLLVTKARNKDLKLEIDRLKNKLKEVGIIDDQKKGSSRMQNTTSVGD